MTGDERRSAVRQLKTSQRALKTVRVIQTECSRTDVFHHGLTGERVRRGRTFELVDLVLRRRIGVHGHFTADKTARQREEKKTKLNVFFFFFYRNRMITEEKKNVFVNISRQRTQTEDKLSAELLQFFDTTFRIRRFVDANLLKIRFDSVFLALIIAQPASKIFLRRFQFLVQNQQTVGVTDRPAEQIIDLSAQILKSFSRK